MFSLKICAFVLFFLSIFLVFLLVSSATSVPPPYPAHFSFLYSFFCLFCRSSCRFSPSSSTSILSSLLSLRHWVQSWPRPETKPRRHRTTCYTPRMWKRAETNTKRCGRSDRATRSSASTSLNPCEDLFSCNSCLFFCFLFFSYGEQMPPSFQSYQDSLNNNRSRKNHPVKLCQSPRTPHLRSESGFLPDAELPTCHFEQDHYYHTAVLNAEGGKLLQNQNGSIWNIFYFWVKWPYMLLFLSFCLMTCMQCFSIIPVKDHLSSACF